MNQKCVMISFGIAIWWIFFALFDPKQHFQYTFSVQPGCTCPYDLSLINGDHESLAYTGDKACFELCADHQPDCKSAVQTYVDIQGESLSTCALYSTRCARLDCIQPHQSKSHLHNMFYIERTDVTVTDYL